MPTAVVVSPHPDDEILGAGATLALLLSNGWRVVNLACSLGRPADRRRRHSELLEASARIGFETVLMDPLASISGGDDLVVAQKMITKATVTLLTTEQADLVVGPHPNDRHHGHEVVGRAVRDALEELNTRVPWWMWGLWAELPHPTLYVPFEDDTLSTISHALAAHAGENERNAFDRLLPARATAASVLGTERIFGFGSPQAASAPYAELLTEVVLDDGWRRGRPRVLNMEDPLPQAFDAEAYVS